MKSIRLKTDGVLFRLCVEAAFLIVVVLSSYLLFSWLNPSLWVELLAFVMALTVADSILKVLCGEAGEWSFEISIFSRTWKILIGCTFGGWTALVGYSVVHHPDGGSSFTYFIPLAAILFVGWQVWKLVRILRTERFTAQTDYSEGG